MCHWKKITALLLCPLLIGGMLAGCGGRNYDEATQNTAQSEQALQGMNLADLLNAILDMKCDLEAALQAIAKNDSAAAREKADCVAQNCQQTQQALEQMLNRMGDGMPSLQKELQNMQGLLNLMDVTNQALLNPTIEKLETTPTSKLQQDGICVAILAEYLELADSLMPGLAQVVEAAEGLDLSIVDSDGRIAAYLEQGKGLLTFYNTNPELFLQLGEKLSKKGNRLYLLAVQDSAEIRAAGGSPGYMGILCVRDGVLRLESFNKVKDVLPPETPGAAKTTQQESSLFNRGMSIPWNVTYCPDFERVAGIWALAYEAKHGEKVDGVISVSPSVLQDLLRAIHWDMKLFDGNLLDGKSAARVLQHDIYFQYYGAKYVLNADMVLAQIAEDAAQKTMNSVLENTDPEDLIAYIGVAKKAIADRTLMIWMADASTQQLVAQQGWNGGLNTDPQNPQAGVYISGIVETKMGWYLDMDTTMGSRVRNEDRSYTYPITVTLTNHATKDDLKAASYKITGGGDGTFRSCAYFFAPAGGTVSDFKTSGASVEMAQYHDLQLGYVRTLSIPIRKPVTITYNVTTAPGVETMLTFSKTPTVQDYR